METGVLSVRNLHFSYYQPNALKVSIWFNRILLCGEKVEGLKGGRVWGLGAEIRGRKTDVRAQEMLDTKNTKRGRGLDAGRWGLGDVECGMWDVECGKAGEGSGNAGFVTFCGCENVGHEEHKKTAD